jgi:uncharacterized protein with von Willebrand factor type A (vWA) domain
VTEPGEPHFFLWTLFQQLRRRGFALGLEEYEAVRSALRAGFGWSSRRELREVCSALWAKSREERAVVAALFDQHFTSDWRLDADTVGSPAIEAEPAPVTTDELTLVPLEREPEGLVPETASMGGLPPLTLSELPVLPYQHVFLPQFPVSFRAVAQAWRRLRRLVREGPATELDVEATVQRRCGLGVVSPPVLRPRRRNRAKLLLLVDQQGSMTPFHSYVDEVCRAIRQAGRLRQVGVFYFHDAPLEGADSSVLEPLQGLLFPSLDPVLADVPPLTQGTLMRDPDLMAPMSARDVISEHGRGAAVVILSDGGAARGRYDLLRLLDTVAFLKGAKEWSDRLVWLNPLPSTAWAGSTAAEIARYVPMFPMDRGGMYRAVNVLRGQPFPLEKPLTAGAWRS